MISRVPDRRIAAEAAEWAVRIDAGPLEALEKVSLAEWLRQSSAHVEELLFSASLMAGLAHVDADRSMSIEALLEDIAPDVIPLFEAPGDPGLAAPAEVEEFEAGDAEAAERAVSETAAPARALPRFWPAIAASLVAVLAVSWYALDRGSGPQVEAASGDARLIAAGGPEPQPVALADGSIMYMNTASRARVGYSPSRRLIELLEGEALFDVAHDASRPFAVLAGSTRIEALGTKFTVEHGDGEVTVRVMEGRVRVSARDGASRLAAERAQTASGLRQPLQLGAGEEAFVSASGAARSGIASAPAPGAWQVRQLSYTNEGLGVIAAEFNRFNALKIIVADAELARDRFSGVFDAHDPESFIAFLELSADVHVDRPREGQVVLTAVYERD